MGEVDFGVFAVEHRGEYAKSAKIKNFDIGFSPVGEFEVYDSVCRVGVYGYRSRVVGVISIGGKQVLPNCCQICQPGK